MMAFSELVDLVLVVLYDLERFKIEKDMTAVNYLPLDWVAGDLSEPVPRQWMTDAAKILEMRGYAECMYTFGGGCKARITGLGRLEVEQNKAKYLEEFKKKKRKILARHEHFPATETIEEERKPAFDLVGAIHKKIEADSSIGEKEKRDLLFDLRTVEEQLKRREPNRPLLAAVLDGFSRIPSVPDEVASLVKLLNP
ncbi:MAG: hypothetical protein WBQ34_13390 [Candidatus Acidiferrales bacterium]